MDDLQVRWTGHDRAEWEALHQSCAGSLQQSWAYGQAMQALGVPCLRARVFEGGRLVGAAQFLGQRLPWFVRSALCSRGPLWLPHSSTALRERAVGALRANLPLRRPRVVLFTPELEVSQAEREGNPFSGLRRVMTGYSTVLVDLARDPSALRKRLDGKWRNRLAAAEKAWPAPRDESTDAQAVADLVQAEWTQRRHRGYFSLPRDFVGAWQAAGGDAGASLLQLATWSQGERVAGMLFLVHGRSASYHLGWTREAGRRGHAHNLLLWSAFGALQRRGVDSLDLGGVETVREPGIARFKIGTGGRVVTLVGSYA